MRNMFTMMNAARIGVGMEGVAIGERAYQRALSYARDRVQGRAIGGTDTTSVPIIEHPDVRRMLLTMKANVEAMRSLLYVTAAEADHHFHGESEEARRRRPATASPCSRRSSRHGAPTSGWRWHQSGVQVHGGAGYIEETGAAQYLRDSRIAPIYEGTNGIQAIDLVLRKLPLENGAVVTALITEMTDVVIGMNDLRRARRIRRRAIPGHSGPGRVICMARRASCLRRHPISPRRRQPIPSTVRDGAGGWLMGKAVLAALTAPRDVEPEFATEKVITARFYGEQLLPAANGMVSAVKGGAEILESAVF